LSSASLAASTADARKVGSVVEGLRPAWRDKQSELRGTEADEGWVESASQDDTRSDQTK
jgi:hypothetical protein